MGLFDLFKRKAPHVPATTPKPPSLDQAMADEGRTGGDRSHRQAPDGGAVADDDTRPRWPKRSLRKRRVAGLLDKFGAGGLGDVVQSWVGKGENQGINADQIKSVFGMEKLQAMAGKLGISRIWRRTSCRGIAHGHRQTHTRRVVPDPTHWRTSSPASSRRHTRGFLGLSAQSGPKGPVVAKGEGRSPRPSRPRGIMWPRCQPTISSSYIPQPATTFGTDPCSRVRWGARSATCSSTRYPWACSASPTILTATATAWSSTICATACSPWPDSTWSSTCVTVTLRSMQWASTSSNHAPGALAIARLLQGAPSRLPGHHGRPHCHALP